MQRRQRSMDRIGSLPDHILCHILSFLPTKTSVATSTLSTRWRFIWAHVPTLVFHFDDYGPLTTAFPKIINRVVSLHKLQAIDTLRVNPPSFYKFEPETFITNAKFHKLRNLELCLESAFTPTPHLLICTQTLVSLRLSSSTFIHMTTDDVCLPLPLPHLKELSLGNVRFQVDEDLPRFLSGCPVLEDLTLNGVYFSDKISGCLNVSSPALKRLHVFLGSNTYFSGSGLCFRVEINAPALTYLSVNFMASRRISVAPMTSLIEADIKIRMMGISMDGDECECYVSMLKFLGCLRNVKCLTFNGVYTDKFVDMMVLDGSTVRFDNLTKLVYGSVADWRLFVKFLKIADNLQVLVVSDNRSPFGVYKLSVSKPKDMIDGEEVGAYCLSSNLKSITISLMEVDKPEELNVVRYLLEKAKVVEKMEIYLRGDSDASLSGPRSRLVKFLSSFVRGSKACKDIILPYFRP